MRSSDCAWSHCSEYGPTNLGRFLLDLLEHRLRVLVCTRVGDDLPRVVVLGVGP